jgi:hypothetical protein
VGPLTRWPLHPLLLAAYAVLFVYAANTSEVVPGQLVRPLAIALLAAGAVLGVAALLLRSPRRGAVLATAIIVTFGFLGHLATQLDDAAGQPIPDWVLLSGALMIVVLTGLYAARARGSLPTVTAALNAFALALIVITLLAILPSETSRVGVAQASEGEAVSDTLVAEASQVPDRDIWFLVFDRYGSDWSLEHRFGVDNDIYPALEERGFQVVPGARTNYRATDFSLATMLNMRLLDDLTTSVGRVSKDRTPARARIPRHEVGKFLRANGYRYYHVASWYEPTYDNPIADVVLRHGKTPEFDAVLREATALPAIERAVGLTPQDDPFRIRHQEEAEFQIRQLLHLADEPGRKFVFAHVLLPHPPYVFDEDGDHVPKATVLEKGEDGVFEPQLRYTNRRLLEIVDRLLDRPPNEQPIIVISGDEGPFLCGDVDCVDRTPETYGIRFGALRAYHLPGLDYVVPADDTGVNIFRMLFREYFGADLPDLPNRSYDWPDNDHLYDFRDITDELPLPGG